MFLISKPLSGIAFLKAALKMHKYREKRKGVIKKDYAAKQQSLGNWAFINNDTIILLH